MQNVVSAVQHGIKKISLALDASPLSIAVMDEAVLLAERLGASLKVICVEDINLIRIASAPLVKTVSPFSPSSGLDAETVKQLLKLQVNSAKQALQFALKQHQIPAELEVRRGNIVEEVLASAKDTDLLVTGWSGWKAAQFYSSSQIIEGHRRYEFSSQGKIKLGSSVKAIMKKAEIPVLVLKDNASTAEAVAVVFSSSHFAEKALEIASDVALVVTGIKRKSNKKCEACGVKAILIAGDKKEEKTLKEKASKYLDNKGVTCHFGETISHGIVPDTVEELKKIMAQLPRGLLVIADKTPLFEMIKEQPEIMDNFPSSVLIAR